MLFLSCFYKRGTRVGERRLGTQMVELGLKPRLQSSLWEATCKKIALGLVGLQGVNEEHTTIE